MDLEQIFSLGTAIADGRLASADLLPQATIARLAARRRSFRSLLSLVYLVLIALNFRGADGGFGSLADVATLFQKQELLLAGWIHYLAFDLFIGAWEVRDAQRNADPASGRHSVPGDDVHARPDRPAVLLRDPHRED